MHELTFLFLTERIEISLNILNITALLQCNVALLFRKCCCNLLLKLFIFQQIGLSERSPEDKWRSVSFFIMNFKDFPPHQFTKKTSYTGYSFKDCFVKSKLALQIFISKCLNNIFHVCSKNHKHFNICTCRTVLKTLRVYRQKKMYSMSQFQ